MKIDPIEKKAITISSSIRFGKGKKEYFVKLIRKSIESHCRYCGDMMTLETISLDHIVPFGKIKHRANNVIAKKLDTPGNLQIICKKCNRMKGEIDHERFQKLMDFLETDYVLKEYLVKKLAMGSMMWSYKRKISK